MFDWDDEELANIIWGEAGENEDHIVPYPDETHEKPPVLHGERGKVLDKEAAIVKLTEKTTDSITDSQECSNTNYNAHGKVSADGLGSLLDFSSSNSTKLDLEQTGEKAQVNDGSQIYDNQPDDRDGNNFVDYGWANVGSFDDLDKLLSNNDLVYGNASISNTETLWSSSKDIIDCQEKSEVLSIDSPSLQLGDLKTDCQRVIKDENHTNNRHGKANDHLRHSMSSAITSVVNLECSGGKNENQMKEKIYQFSQSASDIVRRTPPLVYPIGAINVAMPDEIAIGKRAQVGERRKSLRCQTTTGEKGEARQSQTSYDPWFSLGNQGKEFEGQYTQLIKNSSLKHLSVPTLPQFQSGEEQVSPLSMTPQEKIEKLRKRQQMRALLAIRKQQQQFRHQVSCNDNSNFSKCSHESQMQFARASNIDIEESLSDSDSRPMMINKDALEDTILHQLENVIARLGLQIRVCIRDSLFRLAQSAQQRQSVGDTVSTNRSSSDEPNVVTEEKSGGTQRSAGTPNEETKTNPIDRAVAHLLFHTPPELSGELLQSLESPSSVKPPSGTTGTSTNFPMGYLNESYEKNQLSCLVGQENKMKSLYTNALENTSINETGNGSGVEIEASSRGATFH